MSLAVNRSWRRWCSTQFSSRKYSTYRPGTEVYYQADDERRAKRLADEQEKTDEFHDSLFLQGPSHSIEQQPLHISAAHVLGRTAWGFRARRR